MFFEFRIWSRLLFEGRIHNRLSSTRICKLTYLGYVEVNNQFSYRAWIQYVSNINNCTVKFTMDIYDPRSKEFGGVEKYSHVWRYNCLFYAFAISLNSHSLLSSCRWFLWTQLLYEVGILHSLTDGIGFFVHNSTQNHDFNRI